MIWVYRLPDRRMMAGGRADRQGDGAPCEWREGGDGGDTVCSQKLSWVRKM